MIYWPFNSGVSQGMIHTNGIEISNSCGVPHDGSLSELNVCICLALQVNMLHLTWGTISLICHFQNNGSNRGIFKMGPHVWKAYHCMPNIMLTAHTIYLLW